MHRLTLLVAGVAVLVAGPGGRVSAQRPATATAYTVAYVDVMASARPMAVDALTQYRRASLAEGAVRIDLFEQVGWPGRFLVVEAWTDAAALEAHDAADSTSALADALEPIRVSGYDERPYTPLSVAASSPPAGQAVHVVTHVDIGPGGAQADPSTLLRNLAEASRSDPGCVRFDVLRHTMRGNHFTIVETWRNQAALDAHVATPHARQYRDAVQPISGSPLDRRLYRALD